MNNLDISAFLAKPGEPVNLNSIDPAGTPGTAAKSRREIRADLDALKEKLIKQQLVLRAGADEKLLVVIQAIDTGGKDGLIRKVFSGCDPSGVKVESFKKPTPVELAHDYLWRVHDRTPSKGDIAVFNRSHYEDVLVVRVFDLVPQDVWSKRYQHIVDFERLLHEEGCTIVKLFLHISKDEQKRRLQKRIDRPDKNWKFKSGDLEHRERWDQYQEAFADAISYTSTSFAPWYVIPANNKWYRDLAVASILTQTLDALELDYPKADEDLSGITIGD